jgi:hypothetical protein
MKRFLEKNIPKNHSLDAIKRLSSSKIVEDAAREASKSILKSRIIHKQKMEKDNEFNVILTELRNLKSQIINLYPTPLL